MFHHHQLLNLFGAILCYGGVTSLRVEGNGGTPPYTGEMIETVSAGTYAYWMTNTN